jgi:hypothetical protein
MSILTDKALPYMFFMSDFLERSFGEIVKRFFAPLMKEKKFFARGLLQSIARSAFDIFSIFVFQRV